MRFNAFLISAAAIALTGCGKKTETPQTNGNVPATTDNSVVAPVDGGAGPAGGAAPAGITAAVETEAEKEAREKAEKEAKKKAEKEAAEKAKAEAKAARVAKRANKSLKTQADMAKEEVAAAKAKIAEERKALEKKLADKPEEEKKKALAKFDEESAATIEELEDEVHDLVYKRNQDALKTEYRKKNPILAQMDKGVMTAESLREFMSFIHYNMFMSPENAVLVQKMWIKLEKAEEAAQKAHQDYLEAKAEAGAAFNGKYVSAIVPETIRAEMKASLMKIYKESSFRPVGATLIDSEDLENERPARLAPEDLEATYEARNAKETADFELEQTRLRAIREAAALAGRRLGRDD